MATTVEREVFGNEFSNEEINELMSWELYPSIEGQRSSSTGIWHPVTWRFHGACGDQVHVSYQWHQGIYDWARGIPRRNPCPLSLMSSVPILVKYSPDFTPVEDYDAVGQLLAIA